MIKNKKETFVMWNAVAEKYRRWAEFNRWYYRSFANLISKHVKPRLIADICCGPGVLGSELRKVFPSAEIVPVDLSIEMCKFAKAIRADAHSLPFKDDVFELAVLCFALHELEVRKAIREVRRILKKEGAVAIADLNSKAPPIIKFLAETFLSTLLSPEYAKNLKSKWDAFPDLEELVLILQDLGFEILYTREFFDVWIIAKKI